MLFDIFMNRDLLDTIMLNNYCKDSEESNFETPVLLKENVFENAGTHVPSAVSKLT